MGNDDVERRHSCFRLVPNIRFCLYDRVIEHVNGNGLPDYELALATSSGESWQDGSYLGNGSGWNAATTTIFIPPETVPVGSSDCTDSQLIDVNDDGLPDWVYTDGTDTYVFLNTGTGWESTPDPRWTLATSTVYKSGNHTVRHKCGSGQRRASRQHYEHGVTWRFATGSANDVGPRQRQAR